MPYFLPIVIALQGLLIGDAAMGPRVQREAWVMGTRLRVVAQGPGAQETGDLVLEEVERLDRLISTWDPSTELSSLNTTVPGHPVFPSPALASLLAEAERWARRTGRAFDPAVGALVDVWDLRGPGRTPSPREVREALDAAGSGGLALDPVTGTAVRHSASAWVDAGAFGKGAALRAVMRRLEDRTEGRVLVDLGGQVWVDGDTRRPWSVAVAHPDDRHRAAVSLRLHGVSVATSGTSERPGHILDPRTGRPAPRWGSVSVVSADPVEADVLSTALYVMGPADGLDWARDNPHVAALFLEETDGRVVATWTPAMEPWIDALASDVARRHTDNDTER